MDDIKLKKAKIISRQILLYFFDFHRAILPVFDKHNIYKIPFREYDKFRQNDKIKFSREMYRLKQYGLIKIYFENKEKVVEITSKGKERLKRHLLESIEVKKPIIWDNKWCLVVFDIPNGKKAIRDLLRQKLLLLGFIELQESVYVFPFECLDEIKLIRSTYQIAQYVQIIIADRIETEIDLIKRFLDSGILKEDHIQLNRK